MAPQKTRSDENFPVGSLLIPRRLRADVHAYYLFARNADDIADSATLDPTDKLARLDHMSETLESGIAPTSMNASDRQMTCDIYERLDAKNLPSSLASDLLIAFKMDAENQTYRTWAELIDYCRFSACPVGRFLMALHDETDGAQESDALCTALQLLNHIQDVKDDWVNMRRVYIPSDWLNAAGLEADALNAPTACDPLRDILQRMVTNTDQIIEKATPLPSLARNRGLAAESKICITLAQRLSTRLKQGDPVANRVKLTKSDWSIAGLKGFMTLLRL